MEQDKNIFQKYSYVSDDDDDFEIGELENFNLGIIAPKMDSKMEFSIDAFSEDTLLCKEDTSQQPNTGHNLKSIFELFEN